MIELGGCEWVNVSSGSGSPGYSRTGAVEPLLLLWCDISSTKCIVCCLDCLCMPHGCMLVLMPVLL